MIHRICFTGVLRTPAYLRCLIGVGILIFISIAHAAPTAWGQTKEPSSPLSLQSAIDLALGAHPEIAAARSDVDAYDGLSLQAGARPNPEISALMEDTRSNTRVTTFQINQPIELGGKREARIEAASKGRTVAEADLASRRAEIRANVITAFFDVLIAQERFDLAQSLADLSHRASDAAKRRVLAGKVSPVEETKAKVAEANVRIELAQAESALAMARKRLTALWGNPLPQFERVLGDAGSMPLLPELADLQGRLSNAPLIQRARAEIERRQAWADLEKTRSVPDLTVSLGARRNEEQGLNQAVLGVSIPLPVFDRNQGNQLAALKQTDKARDELIATEFRLSSELAQAHERLAAARRQAETLQQEVLSGSASAFEAATRGFELGKFNFLDVLDAQRTLFQAKTQFLQALAEAHRASAELERIIGGPIATSSPDASRTQE